MSKTLVQAGLIWILGAVIASIPVITVTKARAIEPEENVIIGILSPVGFPAAEESELLGLTQKLDEINHNDDDVSTIGDAYGPVDGLTDFLKDSYKNTWGHTEKVEFRVILAEKDVLTEEGYPGVAALVLLDPQGKPIYVFYPTFVWEHPFVYQTAIVDYIVGIGLGIPPNFEQPTSVMNPLFIYTNIKHVVTDRDRAIYNIRWKKSFKVFLPSLVSHP